jgi:hypothetical protein
MFVCPSLKLSAKSHFSTGRRGQERNGKAIGRRGEGRNEDVKSKPYLCQENERMGFVSNSLVPRKLQKSKD